MFCRTGLMSSNVSDIDERRLLHLTGDEAFVVEEMSLDWRGLSGLTDFKVCVCGSAWESHCAFRNSSVWMLSCSRQPRVKQDSFRWSCQCHFDDKYFLYCFNLNFQQSVIQSQLFDVFVFKLVCLASFMSKPHVVTTSSLIIVLYTHFSYFISDYYNVHVWLTCRKLAFPLLLAYCSSNTCCTTALYISVYRAHTIIKFLPSPVRECIPIRQI